LTEHSRIEAECADHLAALRFLVIRTHDARNRPVEKGIADLIAIRQSYKSYPVCNVVAVEVKAGKDKLSHDQEQWLARAREQGVMILVVRSLDELRTVCF